MKALKCKPSAQFAYYYSINVLSKCSNIISHPSSKVDRHIDHRSTKIDTSIFEGRHINHRSSKVDTSISEGRHIDSRKSAHRSSKIEGGNIAPTTQHRTDNSSQNIVHNGAPVRSIIRRSYTRPRPYVLVHCIHGNSNTVHTACDPSRALGMYYMPIYIAYMG